MQGRRLTAAAMLACLPLLASIPARPAPSSAGDPALALMMDQEPAPSPTPATTPPPAAPARHRVTLALTGDILVHDVVWQAAATGRGGFDFARLLAPVRPAIAGADLALCHLETPLAPAGGPYRSYPLFAAPPAVVPGLVATGYDGCSTASNHTVDQGFAGVRRTLAALDRAGLEHTGSARTRAEQHRLTTYDVNGMRIAWLSATYGTNGMPVDVDKPWSVNLIDAAAILRDAHRARAAGADAVLVALHWGDEYRPEPSEAQRELAERLTRSPDITLVYGHHAHVVQPYRRVNGTWVIYGLGNLLAGQQGYRPGVDDGVIARVTLTQRGDGPVHVARPRYLRTHIGPDLVVRPVGWHG